MTTTIIAEAGLNHDGDLSKALKLCDAAKDAGAQIAKFQTFHAYSLFRDPKLVERMAMLSLSGEQFKLLARHCEDIDIEFCSTPDDLHSLKFLVEECGVKRIKLGSGSLLYRPLVDAAFDTGLPVLLSTGMATLPEVRAEVEHQFLRNVKRGLNHLTVMHCVSLYPTPLRLANVSRVQSLWDMIAGCCWERSRFEVGYSDHTEGNAASMAAVSLGASVIEKHFTLDKRADGPDHKMSMEPTEFWTFVGLIRATETALDDGRGGNEPSDEELAMIPRIRKDADGFQPGL